MQRTYLTLTTTITKTVTTAFNLKAKLNNKILMT